MRNRLTAQWRSFLNARMAAGIEVPHQSAVMTLGSINQTLSSRGIVHVDASDLREWPMNEVLDAVAQSAWNADDVSETFHLVVPPMNAYFGSYIDAWQDMEFRILLTSVSRIFGAPVHEAKPQDLSVTFSSSAPALGPDGKPESQVYSVEHTDRGTGAKSVRSSSPAGAEPEISLLNFDEASGLRVCYVHLFNHTGVPMGPANSRAPE